MKSAPATSSTCSSSIRLSISFPWLVVKSQKLPFSFSILNLIFLSFFPIATVYHTISHQTHIRRLTRFHLFAIQMIIQIQMQNKQQNLGKECFIKFKNIILTQNILCVFKFEYFINGVHFLPVAAIPNRHPLYKFTCLPLPNRKT